MKPRIRSVLTVTFVLLVQLALAMVPAARHVAALSAILASQNRNVDGKDGGFSYYENLPFLPDPTVEVKRIIARQANSAVDPEIGALPVKIFKKFANSIKF